MSTTEFDEIRPYDDEELPRIYEELIEDPAFRTAVSVVFPDIPLDLLARKMRGCKTKLEFQKAFCYPALHQLVRDHSKGISLDLSAITDRTKAYTYISNHRDIILDSGFLSVLLVDQGMDTVEIAIGDNLLIYPWIQKFVRINKAFIVQRALTMRQMLESSARMSRYIHYTITRKHQSIWIAQREGRAKDSDDRTQESVLKMLTMGGTGDSIERLLELQIAPLSLSYEYDPCDYLKAQEYQLKRNDPGYKKTREDDLKNMQTGLFGYKGRILFRAAPCINEELKALDRSLSKPELFAQVAALIDRHIHRNYQLYPCNYVAYDLLKASEEKSSLYTSEEKKNFEEYLDIQLGRIEIPGKDIPFLREKLLWMYANPLINYDKARP